MRRPAAALLTSILALTTLWGSSGCRNPPAPDAPASADNELIRNRGEGKDNWWDALPRAAWKDFERVPQSQDWFEVHKIRPGIFAIYEPGQFEEVISYLIVGSEKALLFDTGLGIGDMKQVVSELTEKDPLVLNSHTHYDHIGGNFAFDTVLGTATDYTRTNAKGHPHEDVAEFVADGWIWKPTPADFAPERYRSRPFTVTETVEEGDVIELGDRTLEVLLTPGHAPDSLCLLDREHRLLFTGDTFYPATLYAHLPGSDLEVYTETAARLAALAEDVDFLLPAHNEPWVSSDSLRAMHAAFEAIAEASVPFAVTDGNREYTFEGFTILTLDPP